MWMLVVIGDMLVGENEAYSLHLIGMSDDVVGVDAYFNEGTRTI